MKAIVCDFARVILFPKDTSYSGRLDKFITGFSYFNLNEELLTYFETLKKNIHLYIFTSGRNHEVPEIKERLTPVFEQMFYTGDFNVSKTDSKAYGLIAQEIKFAPGEIVFIDDKLEHVEAARQAGFHGIHYVDNAKLFAELQKFL